MPAHFSESVFPAFVSSVSLQRFFFPMRQQVGIEGTEETSDKFQGICGIFQQIVFILLLNE